MAQPVPPPNAKIVFKLPRVLAPDSLDPHPEFPIFQDGDQKKATNAMAPSVLPGARPTAAKQLSRMAAVYPTPYVPPGVIQAQQKPEKKWVQLNVIWRVLTLKK